MYKLPSLDIPPLHAVAGTVRLPGSKSISNRVLLLAGLCAGTTLVRDPLDSDDTRVMVAALRALGCGVDEEGPHLRITGLDGRLAVREASLFLGNAGTAMRPLAAALALLGSTQGGRFDLVGVPRMHERPIGDLVDALRQLGCAVQDLGAPGYPPLRVGVAAGEAPRVLRLDAPIRVRGDVSSQFLTALLLALPLAAKNAPVVIDVVGELISKPYVEITLNLLQRFGIAVLREGWQRFTIPAGSAYQSPGETMVEGDASSASYFIAMGALAAIEAPLRIEGVGLDSIQGDVRFVDAARAMGAQVEGGDGWLSVRRGMWPLRPVQRDCIDIPDAAMTLAAMALYADGPSRLWGIASWRVKETDRIAAMAAELRRVGARVEEGADFIEIHPPTTWRAAAIRTYDDHRMAMALSLAAFNPLAGARPPQPLRILDPACVAKTYPDYFETLFALASTPPQQVPVITIDGPTASGKGTLAAAVAHALGFGLLDSGALYRATALLADRLGIAEGDEPRLAALAAGLAGGLSLQMRDGRTLLAGEDVTEALRAEAVGARASRLSALPHVRHALLGLQQSLRRPPGLVADGRDMGTVVFPDASLKVFLTANAAQRAYRRHRQLISQGVSSKLADLRQELEARDARDRARSVSPLRPAEDARMLDNSSLTIEESVAQVLSWWSERAAIPES